MALKGLSDKRKKQLLILLVTMAVIAAFGTVAYARYIKSSGKSEDKLSPAASLRPTINEDFEQEVDIEKKDVTITVGETKYPVYVRAALVFNWKQKGENGMIYFSTPYGKPVEDTDYKLEINTESWEYNLEDGYYYYKYPVESGGTTAVFIKNCTQLQDLHDDIRNEDCTINLEIITQTVQAVGHTDDDSYMAVEDAWNWSPPKNR